MNIDHPSIQGLIRAATCALYARALRDVADASQGVDGLHTFIDLIKTLLVSDMRSSSERKTVA